MPERSKPQRQMRRHEQERRDQLPSAVHRIIDGPGRSDMDQWVVQVLADIGLFLRAAAPALDYEVGRIIAGTDRPHGHFSENLSWEGARIAPGLQEADNWIDLGRAARENRPPPETQQRALAAALRPIADISCHSWLLDLVDALEALSFGDVLPIVRASDRGLAGIGRGRTAWQIRLRALRWTEFQAL